VCQQEIAGQDHVMARQWLVLCLFSLLHRASLAGRDSRWFVELGVGSVFLVFCSLEL